ncbi:hypothetical protein ACP4OV_022116 [Aristida adscensionis]
MCMQRTASFSGQHCRAAAVHQSTRVDIMKAKGLHENCRSRNDSIGRAAAELLLSVSGKLYNGAALPCRD